MEVVKPVIGSVVKSVVIVNAIGKGGGSSGPSTPNSFPTNMVTTVVSSTQMDSVCTVNATNADGMSWEYSTDSINWSVHGTSLTGSYSYTGLTPGTWYYTRCRNYKGSQYSDYSNIEYISTILLSDTFTGASIDTSKWDISDGAGKFSQNNKLIITNSHAGTINEFANTLKTKLSIASGVAVIQANITWSDNATAEAVGGIYLYKDTSNFAQISSRAPIAGGGKYRLRIVSAGTQVYNFDSTIAKGKDVKIWTDGTYIVFFYWDTVNSTWVQMGTTQIYSIGYSLFGLISYIDSAGFTAADEVDIDNLYFNNSMYLGQTPLDQSYDTFIIAGQSNNSGRGTNNQTFTKTGNSECYLLGTDNKVRVLVDPTDSNVNQIHIVSSDSSAAGSIFPLMGTTFSALGRKMLFVPCALGATKIVDWQPGVDHLNITTLYGSMNFMSLRAIHYGGRLKGVLWWQGESDIGVTSQAQYNAYLDTLANAIQSDLGIKLVVCKLQHMTAHDNTVINAAIAEAWTDNSNVLTGPDFSDLTSDDEWHFKTDASLLTVANRWATIIKSTFKW